MYPPLPPRTATHWGLFTEVQHDIFVIVNFNHSQDPDPNLILDPEHDHRIRTIPEMNQQVILSTVFLFLIAIERRIVKF